MGVSGLSCSRNLITLDIGFPESLIALKLNSFLNKGTGKAWQMDTRFKTQVLELC